MEKMQTRIGKKLWKGILMMHQEISSHGKVDLKNLLREFKDIIALRLSCLGLAQVKLFKVNFKPNPVPGKTWNCKYSPEMRQFINLCVVNLLSRGYVKHKETWNGWALSGLYQRNNSYGLHEDWQSTNWFCHGPNIQAHVWNQMRSVISRRKKFLWNWFSQQVLAATACWREETCTRIYDNSRCCSTESN